MEIATIASARLSAPVRSNSSDTLPDTVSTDPVFDPGNALWMPSTRRLPARSAAALSPSGSAVRIDTALSDPRSEEHTSELQSLMRISYAVFCLKKKTKQHTNQLS